MPAAVPIVGKNAKVTFTADGGGTPPTVTLSNTKWTMDIPDNFAEAPNVVDGMLRAAGIDDATGTVNGFIDATGAATIITTPIVRGTTGTLKLYINSTQFYSLHAILGGPKIDTGGVNEPISWNFNYALASGTVTLPV